MDILVTGYTNLIGDGFFAGFDGKNKIVLCPEQHQTINAEHVTPYQFEMNTTEFAKLFQTYNFAYVIYISYCMQEEAYNELKCLERVLNLSESRENTVFIYINPSEIVTIHQREENAVLRQAAQQFCELYKKRGNFLLDLKIPFLAGKTHAFGKIREELSFRTERTQQIDALFEEDLSEMLRRFLEEGERGCFSYTLSGGNERNLEQLIEEINGAGFSCSAQYGGAEVFLTKQETVREKYGWFPLVKLEDYLPVWIEESQRSSEKKKKRKPKREKDFYGKCIRGAEFLIMFAVSEFLTRKTSHLTLIDYVDFRMFFVVISGMMYGLKYGMVSAVLACITYFVSGDLKGNWQIQFYNIVNWLPFAVYMLAGSIAGYTKDVYRERVENGETEQKILENKYIYLNELYMQTLENKEQYSTQITNYVNSYGRIYDVTRQLNLVLPSEVDNAAVNVMEDMLENHYVAIYGVDKDSSYARLSVCSQILSGELSKSLDLRQKEKMLKVLMENETWVNRERTEGYPDYAYPVFKDNEMAGIIMLLTADYRQMNMDYLNRFRILAGLISDSLLRAREYQQLAEQDIVIEGTRILKTEAFKKEIQIQKQMKESSRADFVLMRAAAEGMELPQMDRKLGKAIRKRDKIGLLEDGQIYLLLVQSDEKSAAMVKERVKDSGIRLEIVQTA